MLDRSQFHWTVQLPRCCSAFN